MNVLQPGADILYAFALAVDVMAHSQRHFVDRQRLLAGTAGSGVVPAVCRFGLNHLPRDIQCDWYTLAGNSNFKIINFEDHT